jgi:hypothetical protein
VLHEPSAGAYESLTAATSSSSQGSICGLSSFRLARAAIVPAHLVVFPAFWWCPCQIVHSAFRRQDDCVTGATSFLGQRLCRRLEGASLAVSRITFARYGSSRFRSDTGFSSCSSTIILNCAGYAGGIQFGLKQPAYFPQQHADDRQSIQAASDGVKRIGTRC